MRIIRNRLGKVSWVERHRIVRFQGVNRQPIVDLRLRCPIPGVTMPREGICNSFGEVAPRVCRSKLGYIKMTIKDVDSQLLKNPHNQPTRVGVMRKYRLEPA